MYDIAIIGCGTAGLTAAIYGKRAGKKVVIFESKTYGGQIIDTNKIDNYPGLEGISGYDFITKLYNQVLNLNVEIKFEEVLNISNSKEIITKSNKYKSKTIIIATGTKNKKLESIINIDSKIQGISYCATCDGNFYKDKNVLVLGGGNVALSNALYLSNICKKVYIVYYKNVFKAEKNLIDDVLKCKNIEIIYNANIKMILGETRVSKVEVIVDNELKQIAVDGIFVCIGRVPNTDICKNILELNKDKYIITDINMHTNVTGIYAAGDVRDKSLRQLVTATSDGAISATEAVNYINNNY